MEESLGLPKSLQSSRYTTQPVHDGSRFSSEENLLLTVTANSVLRNERSVIMSTASRNSSELGGASGSNFRYKQNLKSVAAEQARKARAENRAQLTQWDLRMLLFTRMVSLGYLFNTCVSGPAQWIVYVAFSLFFLTFAIISCYLTIRLRTEHENKIQFYQHIAYA